MTLFVSVFACSSLPSFAEDAAGDNTETTDPAPDTDTGTGDSTDTTEPTPDTDAGDNNDTTDPTPDGETENEGTTDSAPEEEKSAVRKFLETLPFGPDILNAIDTLKGYVEDIWTLITTNETYSNILSIVLAVAAILVLPVLLGAIVVVYAAMGAMVVFAGALVAVAELLFALIPIK